MELTVNTSKRYTIRIERGALDQLGAYCASLFAPGKKAVVITDTHVAPLYLERISTSLRNAGFDVTSCAFPAGEPSKRLSTIEGIYGHMAQAHITRSDFAVALGGGVTGDMAGFAAASYLRGIPFVQVPTTLLSQVDSSVGGKTGVDLPQGKNLVGAFWQPSFVLIDPDTLNTLSPHFFADGMGEVIKYGCIKSRALFDLLIETEDITSIMEDVIYRCVDIKRDVVERDEFDTGERALLNFGHTFGHALEKLHQYQGLSHGAAVGIGMVMMARLGEKAGFTAPGTADKIAAALEKYHLPVHSDLPLSQIVEATASDKKSTGSSINLVLLKNIGESFVHKVARSDLAALAEGCNE
ncbi:3-dehydroquinate synthase [Anaeromassilibacillus sp. D41t1_190614_C2]|uniref:3-dehydroquinate synthase n=1 Tax=Anaeromassilibacillus sp. D41t1_190614_C2 TaxID=2787078 RepID=UPI00189CA5CA|nr:3-dehydroquinate synthase [Anaeromassilibacillus sp. D41t1_190614_C2]